MEQRLGVAQSEMPKSLEGEDRKRQVILFMGPEGSGKSTQAKRFAESYNLPMVVMGDRFRSLAENDTTELGIVCKEMLEAGEYSSDELFRTVFDNSLAKRDLRNGVVIDGVFRTIGQVEITKEIIQKYIEDPNITVIFYRVPIWEAASRAINRGNTYDTVERILSRQSHFYKDLGLRTTLIKEIFRFIQIRTANKDIDDLEEETFRKYEEVKGN